MSVAVMKAVIGAAAAAANGRAARIAVIWRPLRSTPSWLAVKLGHHRFHIGPGGLQFGLVR